MADPQAPVVEPSLINSAPVIPPAENTPASKLFPEPKAEEGKPPEPAKAPDPEVKPPEPKAGEPEQKKEEPKPGEPKPNPPAANAPVDYETLKIPDGSLLSQEELAAVKKEAKDKGLTLDQAQGVLGMKNDATKALVARQNAAFVKAREDWRTSWKNDPEYGGDKLQESTEIAKRAWDRFADSELKTLADQTGFGDHPAVLKMMARIGRMFSEDTLVRGSLGGVSDKKPPEQVLYGKTTPADEPMS